MTARQIDHFRRLLEAKQSDLARRIRRMRKRLAFSEPGDVLDRARGITARESAARDLAFETRLLQRVEEALTEIRAGTFGRCAACDGEIPWRRLEAVPWAQYCIRCQIEAEARKAQEAEAEQEYYAEAG